MPLPQDAIDRIRLSRCAHGTFHLNLGRQTLHLNCREILLLGQVINRWLEKHPGVFQEAGREWWEALGVAESGTNLNSI